MFFKVLSDTTEYKTAHAIYHYIDNWKKPEVAKDFSKIGIEVNKNLVCFPSVLELKEIPEGTRSQFKKDKSSNSNNGMVYVAKKTSDLNKKFLELVKKHNLKYYDYIEFLFLFKFHFNITLHPLNNATLFFIEIKDFNKRTIEEQDYFNTHLSLSKVSESEFLKMKLKSVKKNEEK